jgi:hypothetical protein
MYILEILKMVNLMEMVNILNGVMGLNIKGNIKMG